LAGPGGSFEIFSYPWVEENIREATRVPAGTLALTDPPSPETRLLQTSLIPNLLIGVDRNVRNFSDFRLFEVGRVFPEGDWRQWNENGEKLPYQPKHVAGMCVSTCSTKDLFFEVKGMLEGLFQTLHIEPVQLTITTELPAWIASGSGMAISSGTEILGHFGVVAPKALRKIGISRVSVCGFEFNFDKLTPKASTEYTYTPLPRFPRVEYDLSLLFDVSVLWQNIREVALGASDRVVDVRFIDEYQGEQIPEGKRSVAFQITLGDPEATLTSEEAQKVVDKIVRHLGDRFGAKMRDR
ncbi:MAG: hypothetical protein KDD60_09515, partial [Bdellovibrionales bacterium]|nr:hypothetical protein [Bdellovibrionales bacterium]